MRFTVLDCKETGEGGRIPCNPRRRSPTPTPRPSSNSYCPTWRRCRVPGNRCTNSPEATVVKNHGTTELLIPGKTEPTASTYARRKERQRFRRRAAIEPHIRHLKSDFRLGRNFLRGLQGDAMYLLLAATAANLGLWVCSASACLHAFLACLRFLQGLSPIFSLSPLRSF